MALHSKCNFGVGLTYAYAWRLPIEGDLYGSRVWALSLSGLKGSNSR